MTEPTKILLDHEIRALSEGALVGLYVLQEGYLKYVNNQFAQLLDYETPEELLSVSFEALIHPEDSSQFEKRIGENDIDSSTIDLSLRVKKQNGDFIRVNLQADRTTFEGKPALMGCLIDTTTIEVLETYLDKYWTIINDVEDMVAELDLQGNITFCNDAAYRMVKMPKDELLGKNYRSFMAEKWAKVARKAYTRIFRTGIPGKNIIYEITRNDGKRILVEDSASVIRDRDGAITGFRTVSRDISGREQAEKKLAEQRAYLEAVFRSVTDAIITVDPQLRVIEANALAEKICGLDAKTIKGQIFPQCSRLCSASCCDVLRKTLEKKTSVKDYRVECGLKEGNRQIVSVSSSPLMDAEGDFTGAVLVVRDISLLRDLERELRVRHRFQDIIGKNKKMQEIYLLVEDLADLETTVLVTGASGTGKDMIARSLHDCGQRALHPFITVNCSALTENLLESELFGHIKGAFTGAVADKVGRFEAADGGTILLDEIGDISPLIQLKLLRVLQEKNFERVGSATPQNVDVRVIACTNKDLQQKVKCGEFRKDLYYRLKIVEIHMPTLRERLEDVPLLTEHFCQAFNKQYNKTIQGISKEVLARFLTYPWPGNVRELKHVIESAFVHCDEPLINLAHLPMEIQNFNEAPLHILPNENSKFDHEIEQLLKALRATYWNKSKAAQLLGISRQTLYRKIHEYGIQIDS